ncbi:MAG: hypothetical protein KatS3mg051_1911 [Anaerolineae bacterium]|nr:MAG: hypothetical protein KatS3mg051_1911 [Anaerolineae bacterium]
MIAILDTNKLQEAEADLGAPVEQLLTPLTRYARVRPEGRFAIDNGAFSRFDEQFFRSLLRRERDHKRLCRFVALPDVVGDARRTLEAFDHWRHDRDLRGWPLALVAQDGLENLGIPWQAFGAIFIGGTTTWKMSDHARNVIRAAQIMGKWVHVGRVNTPGRWEYFEALGVDSIDGSGLARYSWMRQAIWEAQQAPRLFD